MFGGSGQVAPSAAAGNQARAVSAEAALAWFCRGRRCREADKKAMKETAIDWTFPLSDIGSPEAP